MWCRPFATVFCRSQAPGGAAGSASGAQPAPFLFHAWDAGFRSRRFMCSRYDKDVETKSYPVLSQMLTSEVAHLLEFAPAVSHTLSSSRAGALLVMLPGGSFVRPPFGRAATPIIPQIAVYAPPPSYHESLSPDWTRV